LKSLKESLCIFIVTALATGVYLASNYLSYPNFVLLIYFLLALVFSAFLLYPFKIKEIPLSLQEAFLLFILIMLIRLSSYATKGMLLEKLPMILLVFLWAFPLKGWKWSELGLRSKGLWQQISLGLALAALYYFLYHLIFFIFSIANYQISNFSFYSYPQSDIPWEISPAIWQAIVYLYANFAEELYFRGFLLRGVIKEKTWIKNFFFQALLFGLYHMNYGLFTHSGVDFPFLCWYVVWTFLFGLGFGLAYFLTSSIISTTILHVLSNLFQANWIVLFLPSGGGQAQALAFRESMSQYALLADAVLFTLVLFGLCFFRARRPKITSGTGGFMKEESTNF